MPAITYDPNGPTARAWDARNKLLALPHTPPPPTPCRGECGICTCQPVRYLNPDTHCTTCGEVLSEYGHCWQHDYPPMGPDRDATPQPQATVTK